MTAIKKTTSKSAKSPAPATKSAKSAPKKTASASTSVAPASAGGPAVVITHSGPNVKANLTSPASTTVTARIDIGFGNTLYVRGEGPGLSWDKGVPMNCISNDEWQISLGESSRPFLIKFLINDATWSSGPDYTVPSGVKLMLVPQF
jgi:hypothetical protein